MTLFERLEARAARSAPAVLVDGGLAVFFLVLCLGSVASQEIVEPLHEPRPSDFLAAALVALPIAIRRRTPLAALVVSVTAISLLIITHSPEGATPLALAVLVYSVAAWSKMPKALAGLGAVALALACMATVGDHAVSYADAVFTTGVFAILWSGGVAMRARRDADHVRVQRATEQVEAETQRAARALAEERLRIAQELHDVVAHSISVIAVQAGVGAHFLDTDRDETRAALDAINRTSRSTLNELRHLLGALRGDDGAPSHTPSPTLAEVPSLVDEMRGLGMPIELTVTGDPSGEHRAIEMSAFRVVQEALTNVLKHAGTTRRVSVNIDHHPDHVRVEVVDDGRGVAAVPALPSGRHGLLGMRERIDMWGGTLESGPRTGGGFGVVADFPFGTTS